MREILIAFSRQTFCVRIWKVPREAENLRYTARKKDWEGKRYIEYRAFKKLEIFGDFATMENQEC